MQSEGWITADGVLAPAHDAAHVHWGGNWRMPTKQELEDLNSKCDWTRTSTNGVDGFVVRGKGDYASNSIFLPYPGYGSWTGLTSSGSGGYYWSSVPVSASSQDAWDLGFYVGYRYSHNLSRWCGQSVRPVQGVAE